jgi:hypothetical protein
MATVLIPSATPPDGLLEKFDDCLQPKHDQEQESRVIC